jgi:hypothetical protein
MGRTFVPMNQNQDIDIHSFGLGSMENAAICALVVANSRTLQYIRM